MKLFRSGEIAFMADVNAFIRDECCQDCRNSTGGDCGRHGPAPHGPALSPTMRAKAVQFKRMFIVVPETEADRTIDPDYDL